MKNEYINIKEVAQAKGLKSTRSIRIEINKAKILSLYVGFTNPTNLIVLFKKNFITFHSIHYTNFKNPSKFG